MIQLFSNEIKNYYYYFNTLDMPGSSYLNIISEDEIMILSDVLTSNNHKISITINSIYGNPDLYLDNCRIFPFCQYEDAFYLANLEEVNKNKMYDYNSYFKNKQENLGIIHSYQPLLIIHCPHKNGCLFEISYFNEKDDIILKEEVLFNQNILKDEKNNFIIDFKNHNNIKEIIIDLTIFKGNVNISLNYKEEIFILNKYEYIIDVNSNDILKENKKLNFTISGIINSFYSIKYKLIREDYDNNKGIKMLYNRINYIEYIDSDKYIIMESPELNSIPILMNFYSPNCQFKITKNNNNVETYLFNNFY
jgi:hypothetical protein